MVRVYIGVKPSLVVIGQISITRFLKQSSVTLFHITQIDSNNYSAFKKNQIKLQLLKQIKIEIPYNSYLKTYGQIVFEAMEMI